MPKKQVIYSEVRACASSILRAIHNGEEPKIKDFRPVCQRAAWRLLFFENLVRPLRRMEVTKHGKNHISRHGYEIYPRKP